MKIESLDIRETINELSQEVQELMLKIYPVGSLYFSTTSTNPGSFLGGTWQRYGNGKAIVGVDENDTSFNSANKTGGEKSHVLTIAELASHTHSYAKSSSTTGSTTLTIDQIPSHDHGSRAATSSGNYTGYAPNMVANSRYGFDNAYIDDTGGGKGHTHSITTTSTNSGSTGSANAHNNLQPYITCYIWKRVN